MLPQNPYRLNERLVIQQGIFLCPGDIGHTFEENLWALQSDDDAGRVLQLRIPASKSNEILGELYAQNINNAVLFPGLSGFARSLGHMLAIEDILCPEPLEDTP